MPPNRQNLTPEELSETGRGKTARGRGTVAKGSEPIPCSWQQSVHFHTEGNEQGYARGHDNNRETARPRRVLPISLCHFRHRSTTVGQSTHDERFLGLPSIPGWCQCKLPGSPPATHSGNPPCRSQTGKATGQHTSATSLMTCAQPSLVYDFNEGTGACTTGLPYQPVLGKPAGGYSVQHRGTS